MFYSFLEDILMTKQNIYIKKISGDQQNISEFKEWEEHFRQAGKNKNPDIEIQVTSNHYFVYQDNIIVGTLYLKSKNDTLYFVFYSLKKFTRKGLGLGKLVLEIINSKAQSQNQKHIGVLTAKSCGVAPYYQKNGFEIIKQNESGSIWMQKKVY